LIPSEDQNMDDFLDAMKDVKPLSKSDKVSLAKPTHTLAQQLKREAVLREDNSLRNYLSVEKVEPLDPFDHLSYKKPGVQEGVFKNLRLGKYKIDGVVNLQKLKFEQARSLVFDKIIDAQRKGVRTLLLQHGLGQNSKPFPAFMKSYVYQWLQQMPQVLAFHSAQRHHGGLAAVYVLIKKSDQEKTVNRELHRKR